MNTFHSKNVVVGAGISGLMLCESLVNRGEEVTLVGPVDNRVQTICTWRHKDKPTQYADHIINSWDQWEFSFNSHVQTHHGNEFLYEALNGQSLKKALELRLSESENFTRIDELVDRSQAVDNFFEVTTKDSKLIAANLFDSRPPQFGSNTLVQQFFGIVVHTKYLKGELTRPKLMDFTLPQRFDGALAFTYILPLTAETTLIEATIFARTTVPYEALRSMAIEWLVKSSGEAFNEDMVLYDESGCLPMGDVVPLFAGNPIGLASGSARPCSGYALSGLERQLSELTHENGYSSVSCSPYSKLSAWMDRIFLRVLNREPQIGLSIFAAMTRGLSGDRFAGFMTDNFTAVDALRLITTLPKYPFIRAVLKNDN